jgi:hypothetical protein
MILTLILIYIGFVLLNRWLCQIAVKHGHDHTEASDVAGWFIPIFYTLWILPKAMRHNHFIKWFRGDYWN